VLVVSAPVVSHLVARFDISNCRLSPSGSHANSSKFGPMPLLGYSVHTVCVRAFVRACVRSCVPRSKTSPFYADAWGFGRGISSPYVLHAAENTWNPNNESSFEGRLQRRETSGL